MALPDEPPTRPRAEALLPTESRNVVLVLRGPISPDDVPGLCEHVHRLLQFSGADLVTCDLSTVTEPDVGTVDALARLQLTARLHGRSIHLQHAVGRLRALVDLVGLGEVLPCRPGQGEPPTQPGPTGSGV